MPVAGVESVRAGLYIWNAGQRKNGSGMPVASKMIDFVKREAMTDKRAVTDADMFVAVSPR